MQIRNAILLLFIAGRSLAISTYADEPNKELTEVQSQEVSHREGRIFIQYPDLNIACNGLRFGEVLLPGFCDYLGTCLLNGGQKVGYCNTRGVCCLNKQTCNGVLATKFGYFMSPNYVTNTFFGSCELQIRPFDNTICQVRFDFTNLVLAQPDSTGKCATDFLQVTGSDPRYAVPTICGSNTGQHMYLTFADGEINVKIRATDKKWIIAVTQIPCTPIAINGPTPAGCLQYFPAATGTVSSFNFIAGQRGQNLANQNYEVCLARTTTSCSFVWTTDQTKYDITPAPLNNVSYNDDSCSNGNYISITGGAIAIANIGSRNLRCGKFDSTVNKSLTVTSTVSERMRVFFGSSAVGRGFQFTFTRSCT